MPASRCSSGSASAGSVKNTASRKATPSPKRQQLLTPPATPTRALYKELATITVGEDKVEFPVHKDIFTLASPFFRAAFSPTSAFLESRTNTVRLPSIRSDDFAFFEQYIYSRSLAHEDLEATHPAFFKLIRLYALADQLEVEALRNAVVDEVARLADKWNSVPTPNDTVSMDELLMDTCGLRRVVVDLFVWKKTDVLVEAHEDSWSEVFLREIFCRAKRVNVLKEKAPFRDAHARCERYHEHRSTEPCVFADS